MNSRYLLAIALVAVFLIALLFWNGPHSAQGAGQNILVLCSSCAYSGLPQEGHLVLMDSSTGEIWIYSDAAIAGKANPINWGKLALGQPVVRMGR